MEILLQLLSDTVDVSKESVLIVKDTTFDFSKLDEATQNNVLNTLRTIDSTMKNIKTVLTSCIED